MKCPREYCGGSLIEDSFGYGGMELLTCLLCSRHYVWALGRLIRFEPVVGARREPEAAHSTGSGQA